MPHFISCLFVYYYDQIFLLTAWMQCFHANCCINICIIGWSLVLVYGMEIIRKPTYKLFETFFILMQDKVLMSDTMVISFSFQIKQKWLQPLWIIPLFILKYYVHTRLDQEVTRIFMLRALYLGYRVDFISVLIALSITYVEVMYIRVTPIFRKFIFSNIGIHPRYFNFLSKISFLQCGYSFLRSCTHNKNGFNSPLLWLTHENLA